MIWGIDLGVRSVHLAGIEGYGHYTDTFTVPIQVIRSFELDKIKAYLAGSGISEDDDVFVETPPMVRNIRTHGEMHQVLGTVLSTVGGREVNVSSWKQATVGAGNADKISVSRWLKENHPSYSAQCGGDQNLVDATCIALYGQHVLSVSEVL
jgi:Holliday junction resolvasome RuvABC endonuclease subunit